MRQIRLLEVLYSVTVVGFGDKPDASIGYIKISKLPMGRFRKGLAALKLLAGRFEGYYWGQEHVQSAARLLKDCAPSVVIANDLSALPLGLKVAGNRPVIYDAHEYSPGEYENQFVWRLLFRRYNHEFCRKYLPQVASMLTVCQGIAEEYARHYGVKPLVVHNAPSNQDLSPSPVQNNKVRMIHHGVASSARHLETMIDMMAGLDQRFTLDLMLIEVEPGYMDFLRSKAQHDARIRFVSPVPMSQICQRINEYDVGLYLLSPDNFNHRHALPNKFFEFIQACLVVAIGPSPEMAKLVREYECGLVAESFDPASLVNALMQLTTERVESFKEASHRAAQALCFEESGKIIKSEIENILSSGGV